MYVNLHVVPGVSLRRVQKNVKIHLASEREGHVMEVFLVQKKSWDFIPDEKVNCELYRQ